MKTVYDKDGKAHEREPIDAREMVASGHYFDTDPTKTKPAVDADVKGTGAAAGGDGGSSDAGGETDPGDVKDSITGKPLKELTVAEIKGRLDQKNVVVPPTTRKKDELIALLVANL